MKLLADLLQALADMPEPGDPFFSPRILNSSPGTPRALANAAPPAWKIRLMPAEDACSTAIPLQSSDLDYLDPSLTQHAAMRRLDS